MKILIIGADGFVGSAFHRLLTGLGEEVVAVTRQNYKTHVGTTADVVIEAACNSKKFFAEERPFEEFDASVGHRLRTLRDFPAPMHLHISSVDVYSNLERPETTREDEPILAEKTTFYGLHKLMAEELVRKYASQWLIVRLAGMVGPGLRKNPVYDILNSQPLRIHPDSRYQFLSTDDAASIAWTIFQQDSRNEVINVCGAATISPRRVAEIARKDIDLSLLPTDASPRVVDVSIQKLSGMMSVPSTIDAVTQFVKSTV